MKTITEIRKELAGAIEALEALDHHDSVLENEICKTQFAIEQMDRMIVRRMDNIFNPAN